MTIYQGFEVSGAGIPGGVSNNIIPAFKTFMSSIPIRSSMNGIVNAAGNIQNPDKVLLSQRAGSLSYQQITRQATGTVKHYQYDFYYRIHVNPVEINAGNVVASKNFSIFIWNAFFNTVDWNNIFGSGNEGLNLTGVSTPITINALDYLTLNLEVTTDGPATINATYTFNFDVYDITVDVTGFRIITIPYLYENGVEETLQWKTDIQLSIAQEQAICLRSSPRTYFKCKFILEEFQTTSLYGKLFIGYELKYALPLQMDAAFIYGNLPIGSNEILFNTANLRFKAGGIAVIYSSDAEQYETIEIDQVLSDRITLTEITTLQFTGAYFVAPARIVEVDQKPSLEPIGYKTTENEIRFLSVENYQEASGSYTQYNSEDLILDRTFFGGALNGSILRDKEILGNELGITKTYASRSVTAVERSQNWITNNLSDRYSLIKFLHSRKGRFKRFYFPSWRNDFVLATDINSGATNVLLEANDYDGYTSEFSVFFLKTNGNFEFLTGSLLDNTTFQANAPISFNLLKTDIKLFGFLHLLRINSDSITIIYSNNKTEVSVPLVTT